MADDVMVGFNNQNLSTTFLTDAELKAKCPLAFATAPTNPKVSEKYVQANTATVIKDMARLGWYPVEAKQKKARKNSSGVQSYHMVVFQNPDIKIVQSDYVECYPRIILTNSHDGMNSFRFMVGLFRLVCSNGLVIADERLENLVIRHIHYTFDDLRKLIDKTVKELPEYIEITNHMRTTLMSDYAKNDFAMKALRIRKNLKEDDQLNVSESTLHDLLAPERDADKGDDLWTVYNILQEKMIKGGTSVEAGKENKLRRMRPVKSFVRDLTVNYQLFDLAKQYMDVA